ncbi:MAG: hypothetical protein QXF82_08500, partial [Nitrososphaeria archaeon]
MKKLIAITLIIATAIALFLTYRFITNRSSFPQKQIKIYGWYWIDWSATYYDRDFKTAKDMLIDGVFLNSNEYTFVTHPQISSKPYMQPKGMDS